MKLAIIGSRGLRVELEEYITPDVTQIVSGGAKGVDTCAREYALSHGMELKEFLPDYDRFGRGAPIARNREIVAYADRVLAFWDGTSRGTKSVIDLCREKNVPVTVVMQNDDPVRG